VCGIMAGEKVDRVKYNVFSAEKAPDGTVPGSSRLNSTFSGNLVDMVRCQAYLEVIEGEGLVENAARVGTHLLEGLHSAIGGTAATGPRGLGLMIAFDLPTGEERARAWRAMYDRGLFAITCGARSIRFRPPLNLTEAQADRGLEIVREALRSL